MNNVSDQAMHVLLAKQNLHELNCAYARAVDRLDRALLASLWHEDATVDVGVFTGTASEYCEVITAPNPTMERSAHLFTNEWFVIEGDMATGESCVLGVTTILEDGEKLDRLVGGRYLDKYAQRDGIWKFSSREFVLDWNITRPCSAIWDKGMFVLMQHGRRGVDDPVYN